ncbi:hypothetical protein J6590_035852 [Homalodisca vitripennis]|nr:hypothetical protein J6590_035852 [Homalodisca vitripennis]
MRDIRLMSGGKISHWSRGEEGVINKDIPLGRIESSLLTIGGSTLSVVIATCVLQRPLQRGINSNLRNYLLEDLKELKITRHFVTFRRQSWNTDVVGLNGIQHAHPQNPNHKKQRRPLQKVS